MSIHDKPPLNEALKHFGVKGMHWGVRKEQESTSDGSGSAKDPLLSPRQKKIAKNVALGVGALVLVAGAAVVAHELNKNGKLPLKSISGQAAKGKEAVQKLMEEPTELIHATRGKNKGFAFLKQGGIPNYLQEYESAFGHRPEPGMFQRFGKNSEKIAASFLDPEGKKDFAGRIIPHEIIIPSTMAHGINNLDDVKTKIWPLLKETHDNFY